MARNDSVCGMDYTHLGRSGVSVSRICLGTMNFGAATSEIDAHQIMADAHEAGLNFFDTSNTYGRPRAEGVTEQIVGNWFAAGSGRRDRTVLATKLYGGKGEWPNDRFLSAFNIRRACEESLRRLGTDHIDLYQMHHVDRSTPWDEIWEAMDVLRTQGKIIYVGSSNFAGWHIAQANDAAAARGSLGLVSEQSIYNLFTRTVEPAAGRPARRRAQEGGGGTAPPGIQVPGHPARARGPGPRVRGPVRRPGRGARERRAGLAPAPAGGYRA